MTDLPQIDLRFLVRANNPQERYLQYRMVAGGVSGPWNTVRSIVVGDPEFKLLAKITDAAAGICPPSTDL